MLVAGDGFRRFHSFAELLGHSEVPAITAGPDGHNVQLLTEFSLKKALVGSARERFDNPPADGDAPVLAP